MMSLSVDKALATFKVDESHSRVDGFRGIKSWPAGPIMKVKVYFSGEETSNLTYDCQMAHEGEEEEAVACAKVVVE